MRILIGGQDEVAFRLVESLMHEHQVTLICDEETAQQGRVTRMDAQVVVGSPTATQVLRRAGVAEAHLFVGCSAEDERNLVACVAAKRLGAARSVCFLLRPDVRMGGEDGTLLAESLGIDEVVLPAHQLAEEILRIVAVPGALDVEVFAGGRVHLLRSAVQEGARLTAGPLKVVGLPPGVVLVMARRGDQALIPKGDTVFRPGDKLTAMGTMAGINHLLTRYLRADRFEREAQEAVVVGGGGVGLAVAKGLEDAGWDVKVIETDRSRCERLSGVLRGLVLHGDGADPDLLEQEQVPEASVLVAVTRSDETNLLVSLLAKSLGVKRIITRADSLANERLFERVGIDVVRSARGAAVQAVLAHLGARRQELLAELEHGEAEVLELTLPEDLPEIPLARMKTGLQGIIGAILRQGRVLIPRGADAVRGGDRILVFCMREEEDAARAFFLKGLKDLAGAGEGGPGARG